MTCPCSENNDLKAAIEKMQKVKDKYKVMLSADAVNLLVYLQEIHESQNGIDNAKVHFNELKNEAAHSYDSWNAAGKDFERIEKDIRRLYYEKKPPLR